MNACQHLHTFIHSFFFSVDLAHPELLTEERLWELNEKKHHYINMSFDISRSLVEGNNKKAIGLMAQLMKLCKQHLSCLRRCFCFSS